METLKFKTNIKCGGCIATVTPHLNGIGDLKSWEVDTQGVDKILTVTGDGAALNTQIVAVLTQAGFKAEEIG